MIARSTKFWLRAGLCVVGTLVAASELRAARVALWYGRIKSQDMAIVLATIDDVSETSRPRPDDPQKTRPGYRFTLKIVQVVRPGKLPADVREFEIDFSASGYATNWEFGAKPHNGMKVMAHLSQSKTGEWELSAYVGGIVPLEDFDAPRVATTRKIVALWEISTVAEQLDTVLAGCRDDADPQYQSYCIRVLWDVNGRSTGTDLSSSLSREMGLSHIWEVCTSSEPLPLETVSTCEYVFGNTFRDVGWNSHPTRYFVMTRAIANAIDQGAIVHHNVFGWILVGCCQYPEHARANYDMLSDVLDGPVDIYKSGAAIRFSLVYEPHTTDPRLQKLNREILAKLLELLSGDRPGVADGAAIAIGNIAEDYAYIGAVPSPIMAILENDSGDTIGQQERMRLRSAWRRIQSLQQVKPAADVQPLAYPWDNLIGKTVFTNVRSNLFLNGRHGASVKVRGRQLWIEGMKKWPDSIRGNARLLITGKLTKVADLPVFHYRAGQQFQEGLPVPTGYDLDKARERYVLTDATWSICD